MGKLSWIGFHPLILAWICIYLSNREQVVLVNGESSQSIAVRSGVPQDSLLGPLLFLLYIYDITKLILSKNTRLVLYAMISFSTNQSVPNYHMLKYSRTPINYPSGQI